MQQLKAELVLLEPQVNEIETKKAEIAKRESELAAREQAVLNREGIVTGREDALKEREDAVAKRETATKTLRDDLAHARARLKDVDKRETELSNMIVEERKEKNALKAKLGLFEAAMKGVAT